MPGENDRYVEWQKALPTELTFWKYFFGDKDMPWPEDRRARLDPAAPLQTWVRDRIIADGNAPVKILDVGAGPATMLGKAWPGQEVVITSIDPLANEYNSLLDEFAAVPPVRTQAGHGEHLEHLFPPNSFDFACAIRALDQSYDPLAIIQGMLEVVKPGCWVVLMHTINGAEQAEYQGLHLWNLCLESGHFVIWNKQRRIFVEDHLPPTAEIQTEVETAGPHGTLWVRIRKGSRVARDLYLHEFTPRSSLTTPVTSIAQPRFPVIDAHNHLGHLLPGVSFAGEWPNRPVEELVTELDEAGVHAVVDLDGGFGEQLRHEIARYREPYPDRFIVFAGLDYDAFAREHDIGRYLACQLRDSAAAGAQGLKVWKPLGLQLRDPSGRLYPVNDPRLDELWATAGALKLPILIHVADPVAFFQPLDRFNERWEELRLCPQWHYVGKDLPSFDTLMEQLSEVVTRHPKTIFIGAHAGCYAENLRWVGQMLDTCPNYYVDISARLGELGRQPYSARDFFIRYAKRILFGTDSPPDRRTYEVYYRFLETRDEYFSYDLGDPPGQGRWSIYGINLPDEVLRQVYFENASRLFKLKRAELPGKRQGKGIMRWLPGSLRG